MDNLEKMATLGTQDTGRRQTKQKHNTESKNDEQHGTHQKLEMNPDTSSSYLL
jgi:hypothetical protein